MRRIAFVVAASILAPGLAAQAPAPTAISRNPTATPAGNYVLDPRHTSVVARVGHGRVSLSTFRFSRPSGSLTWDGVRPENSRIDITIDMSSLETPVPNFAAELIGAKFLNSGRYPTARFVSRSIRKTGARTGRIAGNLTFMGVTKPIAIEAELIGAGRGRRGMVVGFSGRTAFRRSDFGFAAMPDIIDDEIEMILDAEFAQPTG
jgi:polyisoprenoid-binding protein YceI